MQKPTSRWLAAAIVMLSMATGPAVSQVQARIERPGPSPIIDVQDVDGTAPIAAETVRRRELGRDPNGPDTFGKTATIGGQPITGAIMVGQVIDYVLTYSANASTGPMTITDVMSANQTYVADSIEAPPGWSWTTPPYAAPGNQTAYSHAGPTGTTVSVSVPITGGAAVGVGTGGDGFLPIPVGNKIYATYHHQGFNGTLKVMCWMAVDLSVCPNFSGGAKNLGTIADPRSTFTVTRTALLAGRIYYASTDGQTGSTKLGIGCFDTNTDAPCAGAPFGPFTQLPGSAVHPGVWNTQGIYLYDGLVAGVVADPASPAHLFMYAVKPGSPHNQGELYCVDATTATACGGPWSTPLTLPFTRTGFADGWLDIIPGEGSASGMVFVHSSRSTVTCVIISTKTPCWTASGAGVATSGFGSNGHGNLSPFLDGSGDQIGVCLHPIRSGGRPTCFDLNTGAVLTTSAAVSLANLLDQRDQMAPFHIPGTARVLYPRSTPAGRADCFDFVTEAACTGFFPAWPASNKDYGYSVDPTDPENCLIGNGDGARVWKFAIADGSIANNACTRPKGQQKVRFDAFFCSELPASATWDTVTIRNRPADLTGGTIEVYNSAGVLVATIPINPTGGNDTYALGLSVTGADNELTIKIKPTYGGSATTHADIQLAFAFTADRDPQICYQTTVTDCGTPITNTATFAPSVAATSGPTPAAPSATTVTLNLGPGHTPFRRIPPTFASQ